MLMSINLFYLVAYKVILKEIRIPTIFSISVHLTDLKGLIMFFILVLLHTVSKIGMYSLLYILTY